MKNLFSGFSLKKRLYFIIIVVFTLSILVAGIFAGTSFNYYSKQIAVNNTSNINQSFSYRIESAIQEQIVTVKTLSAFLSHYSLSKNSPDKQNQYEMLKTFMQTNSEINSLIISYSVDNGVDSIEINGNAFQSGLIYLEKKDDQIIDNKAIDDDIMQMVLQNLPDKESNVTISEPFKGIVDNSIDFLVFYSTTFKFLPDNETGMLTVVFSLKSVFNLINESVYGNDSKSILLTDNNTIIAVSNKSWMTGKNIIKFQGEEHEIYTKISGTDQNVTDYKNSIVSIQNVAIPGSDYRWRLITTIPIDNITGKIINNIIYSILIASIIMMIGLFIVIALLKNAFYPLFITSRSVKKIAEGNLINVPKGKYHSEFNEIIDDINKISDNLKEISQVSLDIAQGHIDKRITVKNENDVLAISVNKIAENLKQSIIDRKLKEENTDRQLWMRRGRFEVAEAERVSSGNPEDLAFNLVRSIVNYTNAVMGGIYTYDEEFEIVEFVAAYAYGNRKLIKKVFKKGEGLVGTCVVERKKIELNKVPDDYLKISTGLGSGSPGYLVIIPVFFQDKINSVIEIAFYNKPEDHVIEFIEQLSDSIGGWMDASSKKNKTIELLRISTEQTKLLAEKEELLSSKIIELQKVQNEIAVKNAEYESMLRAVNHSVMTVKYTLEGILLEANEVYVQTMGFQIEELIGMNVFDLVKGQEEDLKIIIEKVNNGETVTKQVKRLTKSGDEKWLSATYTPYINSDGSINGVSFFAVEIPKKLD